MYRRWYGVDAGTAELLTDSSQLTCLACRAAQVAARPVARPPRPTLPADDDDDDDDYDDDDFEVCLATFIRVGGTC